MAPDIPKVDSDRHPDPGAAAWNFSDEAPRWLFHGHSLSDPKDLLIPVFGNLLHQPVKKPGQVTEIPVFQKPAMIVSPEQSRTLIPGDSVTELLGPTASILPLLRRTTPFKIGAWVGLMEMVPPAIAHVSVVIVLCAKAEGDEARKTVSPRTPAKGRSLCRIHSLWAV
jgi:hypothetical protein